MTGAWEKSLDEVLLKFGVTKETRQRNWKARCRITTTLQNSTVICFQGLAMRISL